MVLNACRTTVPKNRVVPPMCTLIVVAYRSRPWSSTPRHTSRVDEDVVGAIRWSRGENEVSSRRERVIHSTPTFGVEVGGGVGRVLNRSPGRTSRMVSLAKIKCTGAGQFAGMRWNPQILLSEEEAILSDWLGCGCASRRYNRVDWCVLEGSIVVSFLGLKLSLKEGGVSDNC